MGHGVIGFAALVVVSAVDIATAGAQHWYGKGAWCIQPPIGGGSWECMYYSEAQCRARSVIAVLQAASPIQQTSGRAERGSR